MPPGVIFDMDGALLRVQVDVEEVRQRLAALFAPHGVARPFRPILATLRAAARDARRPELEREGLAILADWEVRGSAGARARDGAVDATAALARAGVPLGIVTDVGRAAVVPALRAAGLDPVRFTAIVTRDDVPAPKPDPAMVRRAAEELGGTPTWYIVDHQKDIDAGRAAGVRVAALVGDLNSLRGADVVVASLRDVPGLVLA
ncbi:MAG TPA: HAD-IA family hydrolase [Haliangiales bacterium]|nr:HAD-IA family hydrolase [Haliangiales bacterium]